MSFHCDLSATVATIEYTDDAYHGNKRYLDSVAAFRHKCQCGLLPFRQTIWSKTYRYFLTFYQPKWMKVTLVCMVNISLASRPFASLRFIYVWKVHNQYSAKTMTFCYFPISWNTYIRYSLNCINSIFAHEYIPGQKSNYTNYWPYFQGPQCILELIVAHVCLGRRQKTKCTENRQPILFHTIIWQYSIGINWNAPHCCTCAGVNFVLPRKVHNAGISKNN